MPRWLLFVLLSCVPTTMITATPGIAEAGGMNPAKRAPLKATVDIERESITKLVGSFESVFASPNSILTEAARAKWEAAKTKTAEAEALYQAGKLRKSYIAFRAAQWQLRPVMEEVYTLKAPPKPLLEALNTEIMRLKARIEGAATLVNDYGGAEGAKAYGIASDRRETARVFFAANNYSESYKALAVGLDQFDVAIMATWPEGDGD